MSTPNLDYLVLDAGAIIRGHGMNLLKNAKRVVTVPEVMSEIRDSKSRDLLNSLPYEIEEKTPSTESLRVVMDFAKKTGDFAALSKTDLKLIALTHMLELEVYGSIQQASQKALKNDFRKTPAPASTTAPTAVQSTDVLSSVVPIETTSGEPAVEAAPGDESGSDEESDEEQDEDGEEGNDEDAADPEESSGEALASSADPVSEITEAVQQLAVSEEAAAAAVAEEAPKSSVFSWAKMVSSSAPAPQPQVKVEKPVIHSAAPDAEQRQAGVSHFSDSSSSSAAPAAPSVNTRVHSNIISHSTGLASSTAESKRLANEDDGVGWVNSNNLSAHLTSAGGQLGILSTEAEKRSKRKKNKRRAVKVACVTTDFSMQNVLLQIGLNIMSVDGLVIKSVKQWVLRCMACYQIHYDMDRLFCYKCGANHLSRVSASVDQETGVLKLHLKKNYQHDTRGSKYSLPAPGKQDRYSGELLLREDQMLSGIWRQKVVKVRKDVRSVFGEDVASDVGLHLNKSQAIRVGLGQRNPNATKGRERRGKAKK